MDIVYFNGIEEVIQIHLKTVDVSGGGSTEIINIASLECALEQIHNDDYYPEFIDKLTHLFFVANKSHCFLDGNKRIAITLGSMFLLKNGFLDAAQRFLYKTEMISYQLAAGRISKDLLREIIFSIVYEDDYSEGLKLKLIEAISVE
ncbi:MAG: type II toxin-antitoxin system death-on-curing family toxin [Candidatus Cloacimonetes bacterium]|jgi:death-on-curing protein|nr:type II toxin-antitoxin system death-on-curing family toxin [Candidatus Cloacimonadota bacterium]